MELEVWTFETKLVYGETGFFDGFRAIVWQRTVKLFAQIKKKKRFTLNLKNVSI